MEEALGYGLVVRRHALGLELLERVRERVVADVVEEGRVGNELLAFPHFRWGRTPLAQQTERGGGEVIHTERVIEARVRRARIDQVREPELSDVAETLEGVRVHDPGGRGIEPDRVPQRVPDGPGAELRHERAYRAR